MTRAKASRPREQEPPDHAANYWNAQFRRVDASSGSSWTPAHLRERDGLVVTLIEKRGGNVRTLDLSRWDVELKRRGPRGGIVWVDVLLADDDEPTEEP